MCPLVLIVIFAGLVLVCPCFFYPTLGPAIKQELFRMLSKKLEEATLKSMTEMLHRNDRSTIYPPDVEVGCVQVL